MPNTLAAGNLVRRSSCLMSTKTPGQGIWPLNDGKCTLPPDGNSAEAKQGFPAHSPE